MISFKENQNVPFVKEYFYAVFDKKLGRLTYFLTSPSDGLAVRSVLLRQFVPDNPPVPLRDTDLLCLGEYSSVLPQGDKDSSYRDMSLSFYKKVRVVDWSVYKFPETLADAVSPLDVTPEEFKSLSEVKK